MIRSKQKSESETLITLTALCSQSEYCEHDLREKMRKWNLTPDQQDRIVDYLYDNRYIDEQRYVAAYVHDKRLYNRWGRNKIQQALRLKHIDQRTITLALDEVEPSEWLNILSDLIATKRRSVKADTEYLLRQKLLRFALSRGFTMSEACKVCDTDPYDSDE